MSNFTKKIDQLYHNPLFYLSKGSIELAHTNFWAWLMQEYPVFVPVFFPMLDDCNRAVFIEREQNHFDLSVTIDGRTYVLENKIKSVPSKGQLQEYQHKLEDRFGGGVLISTFSPSFFDQLSEWEYLSLRDILEGIKSLDKHIQIKEHLTIVREYEKMIGDICDIIDNPKITSVDTDSSFLLLSDEIYKELDRVRLSDLIKKIKAESFTQYLKDSIEIKRLKEELAHHNNNYNLNLSKDFADKNSIVNALLISEDEKSCLGISIQGNQYRRICWEKNANRFSDPQSVFEYYREKEWMAPTWEPGTIRFPGNMVEHQSRKRRGNPYDKYKGPVRDNYKLAYQYWFIAQEESSFGHLKKCIFADLQYAISIIER